VPNYRLTIEYDGTRYHGWQGQESVRTISGELRRAAETVAPVMDFGGAGRTDAGVHALAQSAHLRLRKAVEPEVLRRGINDELPADIHVLAITTAPERFHARHDARSRSYVYQISRRRTAFAKRYVWWVREPLDLVAMERAAQSFVGMRDFARFCERPAEQQSTLVELQAIELLEHDDLVLIRLVASHFLWKMVRRIVGTLCRTGTGELRPRELAALLDPASPMTASGSPAQWTAPAAGLFLERVLYPGEPALRELAPAVPVGSAPSIALPVPPRMSPPPALRRGPSARRPATKRPPGRPRR